MAWRQWAILGSAARPTSPTTSRCIIDPEALILLSLTIRKEERRLEEMVSWWARVGSPLTSVQRMKSVVNQFEENSHASLAIFASLAAASGHRSWKRYAAGELLPTFLSETRGQSTLQLIAPATLMLRLRAAFGVGAKPDVLAYLIGTHNGSDSVSMISTAVGYTKKAVRDAVKDMVLAGLVHETSNRPAHYKTNRRLWIDLLRFEESEKRNRPTWCMWVPIFGFLLMARRLATSALSGDQNEHVTASLARDVVDRFQDAFQHHEISLPQKTSFSGRSFSEAFLIVTESLSHWLEEV